MYHLIKMIQHAFSQWGFLGTLARFLLMKSETRRFLISKSDALDQNEKRKLLRNFDRIQSNIHCGHSPFQFVLVAQHILELHAQGAIVECGCYKGGSTAKLSILAKMTNRQLFVCDSFAGLPPPKNAQEAFLKGHGVHPDGVFAEGEYCASLEEVKTNVDRHGCIDVCTFVPGFFEKSLRDLHIAPACIVMDVDLISSARECLKYLWPRTVDNGIWFTHEACYPGYITGILDAHWWLSHLNEVPPVIFGAGSGLSECANGLAYFKKDPNGIGLRGVSSAIHKISEEDNAATYGRR
jgi:O-methyltransferase